MGDVARQSGLDPAIVRAAPRRISDGGVVMFVVQAGTDGSLVLKVAMTTDAAASLRRAADAQRRLRSLDGLGPWRTLVPEVRGQADVERHPWVLETALTGRPLADLDPSGPDAAAGHAAALASIAILHRATAAPVDGELASATWVDARLAIVRAMVREPSGWVPPSEAVRRLDAIAVELAAVVAGVTSASWIHGDLWAANVLLDEAGAISGFVDWDSAAPGELPAQDVLHLVLYARKRRERRATGEIIASVLRTGWDASDRALLELVATDADLAGRSGLILTWLRFVEVNVQRHPRLAASSDWLERNVGQVVACL